jgi:hypothetical protein
MGNVFIQLRDNSRGKVPNVVTEGRARFRGINQPELAAIRMAIPYHRETPSAEIIALGKLGLTGWAAVKTKEQMNVGIVERRR